MLRGREGLGRGELMFYTRTYLKIEGGKRQGKTPIITLSSDLKHSLNTKDGREDRPLLLELLWLICRSWVRNILGPGLRSFFFRHLSSAEPPFGKARPSRDQLPDDNVFL